MITLEDDNQPNIKWTHRHHMRNLDTFPSAAQKAVISAVKNQSYVELHDILQNIVVGHDSEAVLSILPSLFQNLKHELLALDNASATLFEDTYRTDIAKKKKKDIEAKCTILKIYINSAIIIENAISFTDWSNIEIRVDRIDLHGNDTSSENVHGLSNDMVLNGTIISMSPRMKVVVCSFHYVFSVHNSFGLSHF